MATIYKITSTAGDKIYIGSTTKSLAVRWSNHKVDHLRDHTCVSKILFKEYGVDTCSMAEIEKVDHDKRYERERFWIENTENCVNLRIPGRTPAEYQKAYDLANREQRLEHAKACYLANREQRLEHQKAYNLANSDKIKARLIERVSCPTCGKNLARKSLTRHNKLHL